MSLEDHQPEGHGKARRLNFFGTPIDLLSLDESVAFAERAMEQGKPIRHTALNVAKLMKLGSDDDLAADVRGSDMIGIDGQGIVYGLTLFGADNVERVAGIDLFYALLARCAQTGRKPFILGAKEDQLRKAMAQAQRRWPGLEFAGARNGYFGPQDEAEIVEQIASSGADCLFVAMPTPRKERFLNSNADRLNVPFLMGVGGSVDVLAGHVSRAPMWMQKVGLEWFHRLVKEPRKMFVRYAKSNSAYAWLLLRTWISRGKPIEFPLSS
ncbi:WecB/TagA/CpsF family glycosyltransferase [Erythrobacter sp. HA6-11]